MTTDPRLTFTISKETLDALTDFRFEKKFKNQSQAIRALVEKGLEIYMPERNQTSVSEQAMQLAADYDALDEFGRTAVRRTADTELERVRAQRQLAADKLRPLAARGYSGEPVDLADEIPSLMDCAEESGLDF